MRFVVKEFTPIDFQRILCPDLMRPFSGLLSVTQVCKSSETLKRWTGYAVDVFILTCVHAKSFILIVP